MRAKREMTGTVFIERNGGAIQVPNIDKSPTIFEDRDTVEIRLSMALTKENFQGFHEMGNLEGEEIVFFTIYENGVRLSSRFIVEKYERRWGSLESPSVVHVLNGTKNGITVEEIS